MTHNIAHCLSSIANKQGEKIGLIEAKNGNSLSFNQLESRSDSYAWHLKKSGVKPGDRVMLMVKPSADFICLTFALFKIGAPVILVDPGMGYKNLLRCISGVKPAIFIGIPKAYLFLKIFKKSFETVKLKFCCGYSFGLFGSDLRKSAKPVSEKYPAYRPEKEDLAAIIFTTGSTGPPKGVRYEHTIFSAQLELIKEYYKINNEDIDQPAFPLFALFSTALGACAVIPDMDATKPAQVDPKKFVDSLLRYGVSYSFGSPALWNVVSNYCLENNIKINNVKKVLMAGAPISGDLIARVKAIISDDAEIHTPYGATESLPIVSIESREIVGETWNLTQKGMGTCVGRSLPGIEVRVIAISDEPVESLGEEMFLRPNEIGEIIVSGPVVTQSYDNNERETHHSKIISNGTLWHRMGDTGYLDNDERLWFCGRKAHRIKTAKGEMFTIPCEAIINNHKEIFRCALVGVADKNSFQKPVIIIQLYDDKPRLHEKVEKEARVLAAQSDLTKDIDHYLFHKSFPVDIRHNAKIFREKLAVWAEKELATHE